MILSLLLTLAQQRHAPGIRSVLSLVSMGRGASGRHGKRKRIEETTLHDNEM